MERTTCILLNIRKHALQQLGALLNLMCDLAERGGGENPLIVIHHSLSHSTHRLLSLPAHCAVTVRVPRRRQVVNRTVSTLQGILAHMGHP